MSHAYVTAIDNALSWQAPSFRFASSKERLLRETNLIDKSLGPWLSRTRTNPGNYSVGRKTKIYSASRKLERDTPIQISLHVYRTVALTNRIFTIAELGRRYANAYSTAGEGLTPGRMVGQEDGAATGKRHWIGTGQGYRRHVHLHRFAWKQAFSVSWRPIRDRWWLLPATLCKLVSRFRYRYIYRALFQLCLHTRLSPLVVRLGNLDRDSLIEGNAEINCYDE